MAAPPLTMLLTIEKGPRAGETVQCRPGKGVRIGRVIRGNTFTIKDPSISQKHLAIEHLDGSGWVVTDLGTSNGTFVNDDAIDPLVATSLKDGDSIKFGANTTISVRISVADSALKTEVLEARVTRSRKCGTRTGAGGQKNNTVGGTRRRGRARAPVATPADAIVEMEVPEIEKLEVRDVDGAGRAEELLEAACDGEPANEAAGKKDSACGSSKAGDSKEGKATEGGRSGVAGAEEAAVVDIEKMTLGEWFDSLEKYLPMVIEDVAGDLIADMRERAREFNDFVSERARQQPSSCNGSAGQ